ncbi:hypothetical protein A8H37_22625 [Burkholderia thailandensis]|nr:hypothetical protein A8H37_22625 [Burkholderia thailandensis]
MRIRSGVACPKGGGAASSASGRACRPRQARPPGARLSATGARRAGGTREAGGGAAARAAKTVTMAA